MQDWHHGWKVVSVKRFRYYSALADKNGIMPLEYLVNQWVYRRADEGPLAVFRVRKAAENYARLHTKKDRVLLPKPCVYIKSRDKRLWCGNMSMNSVYLPFGTDFADSVMLIRKCWRSR